jgi:hypothetical protein
MTIVDVALPAVVEGLFAIGEQKERIQSIMFFFASYLNKEYKEILYRMCIDSGCCRVRCSSLFCAGYAIYASCTIK